MCGRYIPNTEDEIVEIRELLAAVSVQLSQGSLELLRVRGDVVPTVQNPVITAGRSGCTVRLSRWGLDKWDNRGVIINARSETAALNRFFAPYINCRCLIPAHGYYEWKALPDKQKEKYVFTKNGDVHTMFFAGICTPADADCRYAVLTREAAPLLHDIHPRMPLAVPPPLLRSWLECGISPVELADRAETDFSFEKAI